MQGFRDFLFKGNLVEIAVAFIMATSFAAVVETFTKVLMGFIGKVGGNPNFDTVRLADVRVGPFITALVAFVIMAAVVYFLIVMPYTKAQEKFFPKEEPGTPDDIALLEEIRDLLANQTRTV